MAGHGVRKGFTIIELLVALVIFTIGILSLAGVMGSSNARQALARSRSDMVLLADAKLEELRAAAASSSADTIQLAIGGSETTDVVNHVDRGISARGRIYIRRWSVSAGPAGSRTVTIRVVPERTVKMELGELSISSIILLN